MLDRDWSGKPDWNRAWEREIEGLGDDHPLSRYASTSPTERWAEFGRVVIMRGEQFAAQQYPMCYAHWQKLGLL